ncbi:MAG: hypothetical protein Q9221_003580 [Calogaya cf. arnoldii]
MASSSKVVDIHTHIYPPSYLSLLRSRTTVPYLLDLPDKDTPPRLIILPSDDDASIPPESRGRPIDSSYSSIEEKIRFMDTHNIQKSVISLANPWLDFLPADESVDWARMINNELQDICKSSGNRLYAFATLPLSASPDVIGAEIRRIRKFSHIKGIILSTTALGSGLDDRALSPIWMALDNWKMMIFLHPHYGLPPELYGPRAAEYGHVLPLALGFPLETTIAFTRMWLCGLFDQFPSLRILVAHAGGAVPYLAGRIESCVQHERHFPPNYRIPERRGPQIDLKTVLRKNVWLDAVVYSETSVKAAVDLVGEKKVMFGTDHPFFPPLEEGATGWSSVQRNVAAVAAHKARDLIMGGNAVEFLGLD